MVISSHANVHLSNAYRILLWRGIYSPHRRSRIITNGTKYTLTYHLLIFTEINTIEILLSRKHIIFENIIDIDKQENRLNIPIVVYYWRRYRTHSGHTTFLSCAAVITGMAESALIGQERHSCVQIFNFSDQLTVYLIQREKLTTNLSWKVYDYSNFV